jgi:hypothetical protein
MLDTFMWVPTATAPSDALGANRRMSTAPVCRRDNLTEGAHLEASAQTKINYGTS